MKKTYVIIIISIILIIAVIGSTAGGYLWYLHKPINAATVTVIEKKEQLPPPPDITPPKEKGDEYDVIVVGGEPEGVAAAVSAAKNGAKVLLIDKHDGLGGLMTYGMLNTIDMSRGPRGELLTRGTFEEFFKGIGFVTSFDVEKAKKVFMKLVKEHPNITLSLNTIFKKPIMEGDKIVGVVVEKDGENIRYYGKRIIDATQDADVAAAAGVPYTIGAEDIGMKNRVQASTLVFKLRGINWNNLIKIIKKEKKIPGTYIDSTSANGFATITRNYKPTNEMLRLRGLNVGKQDDGTVLINALLVFGVNGLDHESKVKGMELAKAELPHIVQFLRKNIPGFENATLAGTASELYVRETRHIKGYYTLSITDVVFNRDFEDRIAIGSYPVDIQATSPNDYGYVYGKPVEYAIPFRCIVPQKVENLLVVGRSASYSHLAAGSARTIPIGMAEGDAAGVAAVYSITKNKSYKEMMNNIEDIRNIQSILVSEGAYLKPFKVETLAEKNWSFEGLKLVLTWGLVVPGYTNNFRFNEDISSISFYYLLSGLIKSAVPQKDDIVMENASNLQKFMVREPITKEGAAEILLTYGGYKNEIASNKGKLFELAHQKGLISDKAYKDMKNKKFVTWADTYDMALSLYKKLK
ncbi:thiamine biosynthesis protein [Thermoanaerobacter sp. YS13]|uniref:FAD-dependent oxidoreductase n=1 Tax=Thermoanaerobacter sp. YS13 TaxID=1511746 RepID=UPI000573B714|nr:FAD-dependent oxidoreductase [Thermoanaerobacter sp. YS13]KHO61734.1 thiamine biosynthesis protein [Thermoanaerobacter sp. YS13]